MARKSITPKLTPDDQGNQNWAKQAAGQFKKGTFTASQTGSKQRAIRNRAKKFMDAATAKDSLTGY